MKSAKWYSDYEYKRRAEEKKLKELAEEGKRMKKSGVTQKAIDEELIRRIKELNGRQR